MIRILFIDDNIERTQEINGYLSEHNINYIGKHVISKEDALRELNQNQYDLVILDIILPDNMKRKGLSKSAGLEILTEIGLGKRTISPLYLMGITSDKESYDTVCSDFENSFFPLSIWESNNSEWTRKFISKIKYIERLSTAYKSINTNKVDTVLMATVDEEYLALNSLPVDWQDFFIEEEPIICAKGSIKDVNGKEKTILKVKLPEMGMSSASHITTKIIDVFDPESIIMVGICGGKKGEVALGDIIVADKSWDYGSGKIKQNESGDFEFSALPNQINIDINLKSQINRNTEIVNDIYIKWNQVNNDNKISTIKIGAVPSGSAVVANQKIINNIIEPQYRKFIGLDMETYGFYFACQNHGQAIKYVSIKAVSDLADKHKDDSYHNYCSYASANFAFGLIKLGIL